MSEANGDDRLHELIVSVKDGLEKEIHNFRDEMTARFDAKDGLVGKDRLSARGERQADRGVNSEHREAGKKLGR